MLSVRIPDLCPTLGCRHLSPATTPTSTLGETSSALQVLLKGPIVRVLLVHCCSVEPWVYPCANIENEDFWMRFFV
jgi:hypothetical protein